jgi:hypothetical protein
MPKRARLRGRASSWWPRDKQALLRVANSTFRFFTHAKRLWSRLGPVFGAGVGERQRSRFSPGDSRGSTRAFQHQGGWISGRTSNREPRRWQYPQPWLVRSRSPVGLTEELLSLEPRNCSAWKTWRPILWAHPHFQHHTAWKRCGGSCSAAVQARGSEVDCRQGRLQA